MPKDKDKLKPSVANRKKEITISSPVMEPSEDEMRIAENICKKFPIFEKQFESQKEKTEKEMHLFSLIQGIKHSYERKGKPLEEMSTLKEMIRMYEAIDWSQHENIKEIFNNSTINVSNKNLLASHQSKEEEKLESLIDGLGLLIKHPASIDKVESKKSTAITGSPDPDNSIISYKALTPEEKLAVLEKNKSALEALIKKVSALGKQDKPSLKIWEALENHNQAMFKSGIFFPVKGEMRGLIRKSTLEQIKETSEIKECTGTKHATPS
jgi:hypothetical protein